MLKNNFKIAWRSLKKDRQSTFLNLVGLSTGLACALFIYLWVTDELNVDKFNEQDSQIYHIMENRIRSGGIWTSPTTSGPTADVMAAEYPEVAYAATVRDAGEVAISRDENDVKANVKFASRDFFHIFSYPLIHGNKDQVLADKNSVVLSETLARKLFNTTDNLIGKQIIYQHKDPYTIAGIFKDPPENASDQFAFVLSFEVMKDLYGDNLASWGNTGVYTFVLLKNGTDINRFNQKIAGLVTAKSNGNTKHRTPFLKQYSSIYLYNNYENGVLTGGRIDYVRMFSIIAIFILVIACINFMNLSTAKAARKMKEIGIKKVAGASRGSLVLQYLGESVLITFLSLVLAVVLVFLLLPAFNAITGKHLGLLWDTRVILTFLGIALATGVIAGSYPALYLSGFKPIAVLKGRLHNSTGELWIRKGLVVFQFTVSVVLIVSVLVVYKQIQFVQTKSLGYNKENIISFNREGALSENSNFEAFLTGIKNTPGVVAASATSHNMAGHNSGTSGVQWEGRDPNDRTEFENLAVNFGMIETLGFEMKEGRSFSTNFSSDSTGMLFNETAIKFMGLKDPIGKTVKLWGETMHIIGVVKDFHYESLHEPMKPSFFRLSPNSTNQLMVRIEKGKEKATIAKLAQLYSQFNPGFSFDYQFLDAAFERMYTSERRVSVLSRYFAGLAILISCLGLFGLAAFTAQRRQKEIGIRKVVGATVSNVIMMLSADFLKLVLMAILIAFPLAWWVTHQWLQGFAFHITPGPVMFLIAGGLMLLITCLTISYQAIRAALANPVKSLRTE